MYSGTPVANPSIPPWIQAVITQLSSAQLQAVLRGERVMTDIRIDPTIAAVFLSRNPQNRHLRPTTRKAFAGMMRAKTWTYNHQGMALDPDGNLLDGQHRLHGIIDSGEALLFPVTFNLATVAKRNIDQNKIRTPVDILTLSGYSSITTTHTGIIANLHTKGGHVQQKMLDTELSWWMEQYGEGIRLVAQHVGNSGAARVRGVIVGHVLAPCVRAYYWPEYPRERLMEFLEILKTGVTNGLGDSAAAMLRSQLIAGGHSRHPMGNRVGTYLKTEVALQAFKNRNALKALREAMNELYWLPHELAAQEQIKRANIIELHRQREAEKAAKKNPRARAPVDDDADDDDLFSQRQG